MRYASYRRSGSHYFGLLLKSAFYGSQQIGGIMGDALGHPFHGVHDEMCDWAGLFAGHIEHPVPSVDIYLVRDGRDALSSLYRLKGESVSFSEFLRQYAQQWYAQTQAWKEKAYIVRYESLVRAPDAEMALIGAKFGLEPDAWRHATRRLVGYSPSRRGIGQWREMFTRKDEAFFDSVVEDRWALM